MGNSWASEGTMSCKIQCHTNERRIQCDGSSRSTIGNWCSPQHSSLWPQLFRASTITNEWDTSRPKDKGLPVKMKTSAKKLDKPSPSSQGRVSRVPDLVGALHCCSGNGHWSCRALGQSLTQLPFACGHRTQRLHRRAS